MLLLTLLALGSQAQAFTYEDLAAAIRSTKTTTLEQAIGLLPQELLQSFTLMKGSFSAQPSSPSAPRAILFGRDAKLVVAFNSDPGHANSDRLELLQYREATKTFELRYIRFANGAVELSPANPRQCVACHEASPRPIWGSYQDWAGAFGDDDEINDEFTPDEAKLFQGFQALWPSHPRYRWLYRDVSQKYFPFRESGYSHALRPSDRLGNLLGRLTADSQAEVVEGGAYYRSHPLTSLYGLLSILQGTFHEAKPCTNPADDAYTAKLTADLRAAFPEPRFPELYAELASLKSRRLVRNFLLQKLLLGLGSSWDINHFGGRIVGEDQPFSTGEVPTSAYLAARLLDKTAPLFPFLSAHYRPEGCTAEFFPDDGGAYCRDYVVPFDRDYDAAGLYFNEAEMAKACGDLFAAAMRE